MTTITPPACPQCGSMAWETRESTTRGVVLSQLDVDGWTRTVGPQGTTTEDVLDIQISCSSCGFDTAVDETLWTSLANLPASPRNT